jgi:hypothetical protein
MCEEPEACPYSIARSRILYEISNGYPQPSRLKFPGMANHSSNKKPRIALDNPTLLARIDRAIYRLTNAHVLPLQQVGDSSDPEIVLRDCRARLQRAYAVAAELREAIMEQVGKDQTDRLRRALNESIDILG